MSLFENDMYQWRETYFVLFREKDRPSVEDMVSALRSLGSRFEVSKPRVDNEGRFESISVIAADDFSAMDICYGAGEDVAAQIEELLEELRDAPAGPHAKARIAQLSECTARLEVYHFQQIMNEEEEDEFLDPGALLLVMKKLAKLCHGISIDPQSGTWS